MATPKKFFHDHVVLLLLSISAFLVLVVALTVLLQLGTSNSTSYIVQYRPVLLIDAFETGNVRELIGFVVFSILAFVAHLVLSRRAYHVRRQLALAILSLGVLLQVMTIIISNALLSLR